MWPGLCSLAYCCNWATVHFVIHRPILLVLLLTNLALCAVWCSIVNVQLFNYIRCIRREYLFSVKFTIVNYLSFISDALDWNIATDTASQSRPNAMYLYVRLCHIPSLNSASVQYL